MKNKKRNTWVSIPCLGYKIYTFISNYVYVHECDSVWVCVDARKRFWSLGSWSRGWLRGTPCGFWEPNPVRTPAALNHSAISPSFEAGKHLRVKGDKRNSKQVGARGRRDQDKSHKGMMRHCGNQHCAGLAHHTTTASQPAHTNLIAPHSRIKQFVLT